MPRVSASGRTRGWRLLVVPSASCRPDLAFVAHRWGDTRIMRNTCTSEEKQPGKSPDSGESEPECEGTGARPASAKLAVPSFSAWGAAQTADCAGWSRTAPGLLGLFTRYKSPGAIIVYVLSLSFPCLRSIQQNACVESSVVTEAVLPGVPPKATGHICVARGDEGLKPRAADCIFWLVFFSWK